MAGAFLDALDEAARRAAASGAEVVHLAAGRVLEDGGSLDGVAWVRAGLARVFVPGGSGPVPLGERGPGDLVDGPRVEALEETELAVLSPAALAEIEAREPALALAIRRAAAHALAAALAGLARARRDAEDTALFLGHDASSSLRVVEGSALQLLRRQEKLGPLAPAQERVARRIRRAAAFAHALVDDLIEAGRAGAAPPRIEPTTLEGVLREAVLESLLWVDGPALDAVEDVEDFETARTRLAAEGLAIDVDPALLGAPGRTDRRRLVRAIVNVLGNALRHGAGSPVALRAARAGERLALTVADRGPGVPEAALGSLFERFGAGNATGSRGGLGLGLAGARRLLESLGGSIRAERGPDGRGLAVLLEVPFPAA